LFAGVGSPWSTLVTDAVFVIVCAAVPASTVALIVSVALAPFASEPAVQSPVPLTYVPWLGVSEEYVTPEGSTSVMTIFVASFGPLLVSVMVYVIVSPSPGAASSTIFVIARPPSLSCSPTPSPPGPRPSPTPCW